MERNDKIVRFFLILLIVVLYAVRRLINQGFSKFKLGFSVFVPEINVDFFGSSSSLFANNKLGACGASCCCGGGRLVRAVATQFSYEKAPGRSPQGWQKTGGDGRNRDCWVKPLAAFGIILLHIILLVCIINGLMIPRIWYEKLSLDLADVFPILIYI